MAEILLYGIIGDPIDKLDAATVTTAIRTNTGPLSVRINSPGGYVMEGLAIIAALRAHQGKVTVHIDGLAASMASAIACAGDEVIMAESALYMVHKPWDSSIGNADDLRRDAAQLDRIEAQLISIYAKRTGLSDTELAAMLAAETWLTPEEALAAGFITEISAALQIAAMADVSACGFRNVPVKLKESPMSTSADPNAAVVAAERTRVTTIMSLAAKHDLPQAMASDLISRGVSLDQARAAMLDHLAAEGDRAGIGHSGPHQRHDTLDNPDFYGSAIRDAIVAKISGKAATGAAAEFAGMSVVDIARDFLYRAGERNVLRMSPDNVINAAMGGRIQRARSWGFAGANLGGLHTTSDFPDLIGGAAEKFLIERYRMQESQLKLLARERSRSNFLMQYGVQVSGFGVLDQVQEAAEFTNRTLNTRAYGYKLETYGNMFAVSRQLLVNDHLGALADILGVMAAAAAETEAMVLAALINSNAQMSDGVTWFHADHKNLAASGGAPSIATLDAGRLAMRSQKDMDGTGLIDAKPKFLLVPVQLETTAETLVAATIAPTTTDDVNPFAGKLQPIADPRIANPAAWYLFADPDFAPALQYSYLEGHTTPFLDSQEGWRTDGTEYKVRHDFGAGVLDYRFAWKNPGA